MPRSLLDVLNTPGYVSIIEGQPGTGKTSLALKACAARGRCTYISYADPEKSINAKRKAFGHDGEIKVVNMMTGKIEKAFSEIESSLAGNELVVVDSIDAMFYGIRDESEIRSFLQMLYGSVKGKDASLVMISEGTNPVAQQIRFVCDAIISMSFESVLGQNLRSVRLLKDRDNPIERQLHYITFSGNFRVLEPFIILKKPVLGRFRSLQRPSSAEIEVERELGYNVLIEMDINVEDVRGSIYRKMFMADYLKHGLSINYAIGPNEDEKSFINDMNALVGSTDKINIVRVDAKESGYSSDELIKMEHNFRTNAVNVVNLLAYEDFAVKNPVEYELYIKEILKDNMKSDRLAIVYAYTGQEAIKAQLKYASILRRLTATEGFMFWRSIRPLGPVYYVDMKPEAGIMNFIEMI